MTVIAAAGPPVGPWSLRATAGTMAARTAGATLIAPDPNRPAGPAPAFDATILERLREALRKAPAGAAGKPAETRGEDPGRTDRDRPGLLPGLSLAAGPDTPSDPPGPRSRRLDLSL